MATAFESFINDNMPYTLRSAIPETGNLISGVPLVSTGVGLNLEQSNNFGFKPSKSIFVSNTNPMADYTSLASGVIEAKSRSTSIDDIITIKVDGGSYTISDLDLTADSDISRTIIIEGVNESNKTYRNTTSFDSTITEIVLDGFVSNGYGIKCRNMYLIFKNCKLKCYPAVTSDAIGVGISFSSGGVWLIDCSLIYTPVPTTSGIGECKFITTYTSTGVYVSFIRSYVSIVLVRGVTNYEYSFIDLKSSSHPYFICDNSYFNVQQAPPTFNNCYFTLFNGLNSDTSTIPYSQCFNNIFRFIPGPTYAKKLILWKSVCTGSASKVNIFERNNFISSSSTSIGKVEWFNYDTINSGGKLYCNYNSFINEVNTQNNIIIGNIGSGDYFYMNHNFYQGLMTKTIGSGLIYDTTINTTPITTKTVSYVITDNDYTVLGNHASTPILFTFPSASGNIGREYVIKNINNALVTVSGVGGQTFDGSGTIGLTLNQSITTKSTGTGYIIINKVI